MIAQIDEIDTNGVVSKPGNQAVADDSKTTGSVTAFEAGVYFSVAHTFQFAIPSPSPYPNGSIYLATSANLKKKRLCSIFYIPEFLRRKC